MAKEGSAEAKERVLGWDTRDPTTCLTAIIYCVTLGKLFTTTGILKRRNLARIS